jgi:hypothetical protein
MRRSIHFVGAVILAASILILTGPTVKAGRIGGPMSTALTIPSGMSVYYDMSFRAGERGVVTINTVPNSLVYLLVYDSDGHIFNGTGAWDHKTVIMDVYRTGVFRVEVRNTSTKDNVVTLTTN